ncbi:MAG: hypothetical protein ACTSWN_14745 [Promethearchaeota archaeon]
MEDELAKEVSSIMNIGFDMIVGPTIRWKKDLNRDKDPVLDFIRDYDKFSMNAYLAFNGGNKGGPMPRAIVYEHFSVVGFPRGLDLICLFVKNTNALTQMAKLKELAESIAEEMDGKQSAATTDVLENGGDEAQLMDAEIKRIVVNMLRSRQMTTPEIKNHFELTNSSTWRMMSELEHDGVVKRAGKRGRAVLWTLT